MTSTVPPPTPSPAPAPLTRNDYKSDQEIRWCPGCGDYAILNAVQTAFAKLGIPREKTVIVSGIGCSSRFPYYMETYGFHSIHGRAPAVATGVKVANPELQVWVVTGDGDGLSIGGNHMIHALRRNVGLKVLLFNNRIYGLTKGQYSPTSLVGHKTKSTPYGSAEAPFNPVTLALGAGATFVARGIDVHLTHLGELIKRAHEHQGTAFIEILQNCNIFNDGAWDFVAPKDVRDDGAVELIHGRPLVFGKQKNRGIRLRGFDAEVVTLGENGVSEKDLLVWDEKLHSPGLALAISQMTEGQFPTPIGVFRDVQRPTYDRAVNDQLADAAKQRGAGDLKSLIYAGEIWDVKAR